MRKPQVTVIVPTYNGAPFLEACLDSVAAQDVDGLEVLVSDDGSTDATLTIARSFADRIEHLRVEQNPSRLGAVHNVNACLRRARGRWVKPVFQDDTIAAGCIAALLDARRRHVPVVVGGRTYQFEPGVPDWQRAACADLVDTSLTSRHGSGLLRADELADAAAEHAAARLPHLNFVGEPVAILLDRRAALRAGGFDGRFAQLWDYELVLRLGLRRGLALVGEPVATFRVHSGSETARNLSGSAFATDVVDRLTLLVAYATAPEYRAVRRAAARRRPPLDLMALATGSAWAAWRVARALPELEQPAAESVLAGLDAQLPATFPEPWAGSYAATKYAVELLHELTDDTEAAIAQLYEERPLAVDLAPPPVPPGSLTGDSGAGRPDPTPAGVDASTTGDRHRPRGLLRPILHGASAVRTNQWWSHMLGPITAFACLQIGWRQVAPSAAYPRLAALLWSAIFLAAFAYVINDASDVEADRQVGKSNSMTNMPVIARAGVMAGLALLGALPWLVVPLDLPAVVVLAAIYLLPVAYSPRPLRLKEHPVLGPVCDASNAFVLPAMFTVTLFGSVGAPIGPEPLMVAGAAAWAAGFGLRAIVLHQVDDAGNDRATGTTTLVTTIGEVRAVRLMRRVLFPLELVGLAMLAATVATWAPWLVAACVVGLVVFHAGRLAGLVDRSLTVTTVEKGWLLSWTQLWPALVLSAALTATDVRFAGLVAVVLVLFWPRCRSALAHLRAVSANERRRWSGRLVSLRQRG